MKIDQSPISNLQSQQRRTHGRLLIAALGLLALLLAGCNLPIAAAPPNPTPVLVPVKIPVIAVAPTSGGPGTTVEVSGAGWRTDEVVYIKLEALVDGQVEDATVAVATAGEDGRFATSFLYPLTGVWPQQSAVQILAESLKREQPAIASFLVVEEGTVTPTPTPSPTATFTPTPAAGQAGNVAHVTSRALNLRSGPGSGYAIIRALPRGTRLLVLGQSANAYWLLVRLEDGVEGWVARPYTDYRGQAPVVPVATRPVPIYTATPVTPYPTATPATIPWRGEYYANMDLLGSPSLVRDDPAIDFDWGYGSPAYGFPADNFSVRWVRTSYFGGGTYRFYANADDGVRIWVDDQLILDQWHPATGRTYSVDRTLGAGPHTVRVEYYEDTQVAKIKVWWEYVGGGQPDYYPDWRGDYYRNQSLTGAPSLTRNDPAIDFNWGYGSPAPGIPSDYFSVRWTRTLYFEEGRYRFSGRYDDGMRIYVDGHLVVDDWAVGSVRERSGEIYLSRGNHNIQVDYFENTGQAEARVWWQRVDDQPDHFPDWKGEYWTNPSLSGNPRVVRNDLDLNFNWGTGSPDPRIPADNFSARWTRSFDFNAGIYRFYARSDDGVRVWVGNTLLIDEWHDNRAGFYYTGDIYLDRRQQVKVEYYEHLGGALIHVYFERIASGTPTPMPTDTPTATPTFTPTPTFTSTPTPTHTPVRPTAPYAEVRPGFGGAGTQVTVAGGGFPANTQVTVYLGATVQAAQRAQADARRYATTTTDGQGDYVTTFTMPATWPDGSPIQPGQLLILVATDNFVTSASVLFDYQAATQTPAAPAPSARIDPNRGGPGTQVTVSGGGFPARTTVNVHLAGVANAARTGQSGPFRYATTTTDDNGDYRVAFTMPDRWPDNSPIQTGKLAVLVATDDFGVEAGDFFDYFVERPNPSLDVTPLFGGPGTQVRVRGQGFPARVHVNLLLATLDEQIGAGDNPKIYATTTTDRNGAFAMTFTMPDQWPDGSPIAAGELAIVVTTIDYSVTASTVFDFIPTAPTNTPPPPTATPAAPTPTFTPAPPASAPSAHLSPGTGAPGTQVTVSGDGFPANTGLTVFLARFDASGGAGAPERYATTTSGGGGAYSVTFAIPDRWPDGSPVTDGRLLVLVATNDFQHQATATFKVMGAAKQLQPLASPTAPPDGPGTIPLPPDSE